MARFEERPRIESLNNEHMSVALVIDTSGSVDGAPLRNIVANINHFKTNVCESDQAAKCVDVCVIAFDDRVRVVQDWRPVKDLKPVELTAGGCTDLNGAVLTGIEKIRERSRVYADNGVVEKKPYLIVLTDGCDTVSGTVDEAAAMAAERIEQGKLKLFFLGFGDYDRATAAQLCAGNGGWCFEVQDGDYNFNDFFDFVGNSVKAASVSAPGERLTVGTPIGTDESNVATVNLDSWLNS